MSMNKQQLDASCHECSTIVDGSDSLNDELLQTTFKWMFWSPHHLVKDDVFFAPSSPSCIIDNNSWVPTPCLSPVTSPSDFLYDREPLFDGIDYYYGGAEEDKTDHCTDSPVNNSIIMHQTPDDDDDWSALFNGDNYDFLPLTPSSTEEEGQETLSEDDEEDQEYLDESPPIQVVNGTTESKQHNPLKRTIEESSLLFTPSKKSKSSTVFENLTKLGIDWCRYCGTTEGVNWRPGPWGKRTLCNKHGCDYKGYGLASRLPRLDLSAFAKERLQDRQRPIVQQFCVICQSPEKTLDKLIPCQGGCSRAYHQYCHSIKNTSSTWYCSTQCQENKLKNKVVVDLPRKYLPLMRLQQQKHHL
ncbi:hypothetical protein INT47_009017 [Mucor saturninus]|uniref:Zinc finger PHD-type domain-containing protein n=1 Tax=Mucor saturninus TaxID=64648 RepID=A0A8H7UWM7_9FUNG|nr:hypothetical protein INT47_009017 [Mucor saturninus]